MRADISDAAPVANARHAFGRVYYASLAALIVATLCLPVLIPVAYMLLGFDPALEHAYTVESFEAHRATAPLRRGFIRALFALGLTVLGLSVAALVRWRRGKRDVHPLIAGAMLIAATALTLLLFVAMITPTPVLCC